MSHGRAFNILFRQWLSEARYFTLRRSDEAHSRFLTGYVCQIGFLHSSDSRISL
jgi:hypothetical protein